MLDKPPSDPIKLQKTIDKIPELIKMNEMQIKQLYEMQLSCMVQLNKSSDEFYLAGKRRKEIYPIMQEWIKLHRIVFNEDPLWYNRNDYSHSIDSFWAMQRGIWNKAHNLPYSNNKDLQGKSLEYKRY